MMRKSGEGGEERENGRFKTKMVGGVDGIGGFKKEKCLVWKKT